MIPDFQSTMLPLLTYLNDKKYHNVSDIREHLIKHFNISEDEQKKKIPSGKQFIYYNRIAWAISYLKMAELIISTERSTYRITDIGIELLQKKPPKININLLNQYPIFRKKRNPRKIKENNETIDFIDENEKIEEKTPDELIEIGYNKIRAELSNQLLELIKMNSSSFFEKLVIDLLLKIGYGGNRIDYGEVTGGSGDEGIDGIIREDKLGLDKIYVQAKKWENTTIGRPEIQKFVGALQGKRAKKGIFITTSQFSDEALKYSENLDLNIVLIDGKELTELMIDYELAVSIQNIYKICEIDTDYFNVT